MGVLTTQTTLRRKVTLRGVGLHSGALTKCVIHPAAANIGIVFVRSDLKNNPHIPADISKVLRTDMSTTLGVEGAMVATVEHLMAAFYGMGISNAIVELDGPEVPIMDGSSREFAAAIEDAGIRNLGVAKKVLKLKRKLVVQSGEKYIEALPSNSLHIRGKVEFKHSVIGQQVYTFNSNKCFRQEIASARTFGFLREVEYLHKKGLAKGGSLDNAVVLDDNRVLNPEGLRFNDEFVRHKVLDALGDFALLGLSLQADVEVYKAGHELHTGFIRKILEDVANYEIVELRPSSESLEEGELTPLVAAAV